MSLLHLPLPLYLSSCSGRGPYPKEPAFSVRPDRCAGPLTEPDGLPLGQHLVQGDLDAGPDVVGDLLHECDIVGRVWSVAVEVDGLEEADPELRRQVHAGGEQTEVGKDVVDR